MHRIFRVKAYEMEHGPHFDEEMAHKAVSKMENEDGSRGPHWSLEETTALANQHGINLNGRFNRYDWYVALNMIYSDFYKVIVNITNTNNVRNFVEFAKAWLADKDVDEGKMWYYYIYVMCDKIRIAEMECYEEEMLERRHRGEEDDEDEFSKYHIGAYRRGGRGRGMRNPFGRRTEYEVDEYEKMREREREREYEPYSDLASQLASCCCDVRESICGVNNNITKMGYENQLANCNQTNTLQNAITGGFNNLIQDNATKFNIIGAKIDAQTQIINDKFCQLEMREMQSKIKESIAKCDEEMTKCLSLLDKLGVSNEVPKEDPKIIELQREVNELKNIIRKANLMVPEPMKNMLPLDMKDVMNKVDQ